MGRDDHNEKLERHTRDAGERKVRWFPHVVSVPYCWVNLREKDYEEGHTDSGWAM